MCGGDTIGSVDKFSEDQVATLQLLVDVNNNSFGLQISFFNSTYHDVYVPEIILKEFCTEAGQFSSEEQAR